MRTRAKVDANQSKIVKELRQMGYSVRQTHAIGKGFPDIIVGTRIGGKRNFLFEIKDGEKYKSQQKLTPDEIEFHESWKGQVDIITSADDAVVIIRCN